MMGFDDLRLVATLAATGSARRTAQTLRVHLATVYRRLADLERRAGQQLLDRGEGFAPTPMGAELVEAWDAIAARLGALDRRMADHDGRLDGEIAVTTTDSLAPLLLRAVGGFRDAHPAARVRLIVSNDMADMARREADVAIRPTRSPPEALVGRRLAAFDYALYGGESDARAIALDENLGSIPSARWWRERTPSPPALIVNSMWAAAEACAAGLGRAVLPVYMERVASLPTGVIVEELRSSVWLLYHPDSRRSPRVRLFARVVGPALAGLLQRPG